MKKLLLSLVVCYNLAGISTASANAQCEQELRDIEAALNNQAITALDQEDYARARLAPPVFRVAINCTNLNTQYVKPALELFNDHIEMHLNALDNLEILAKRVNRDFMNRLEALESSYNRSVGNGTLNADRSSLQTTLAIIAQDHAQEARAIGNFQANINSMGYLLGYFKDWMRTSPLGLQHIMGFSSFDEAEEFQRYLRSYGNDLRNTALELENTRRAISGSGTKIQELYSLLF